MNIFSTYSVKIKHYNHIFKDTVSIYREAVDFLIEVCLREWEDISAIRAMSMGLYEGVNMSLAYCEDCGHQELEMDECPKCGSKNLTKIDRMNGYLSYSRVHSETRLNAAKMAEIAERVSM